MKEALPSLEAKPLSSATEIKTAEVEKKVRGGERKSLRGLKKKEKRNKVFKKEKKRERVNQSTSYSWMFA